MKKKVLRSLFWLVLVLTVLIVYRAVSTNHEIRQLSKEVTYAEQGEIAKALSDLPSEHITICNYGIFGKKVAFSDIGTLGESKTFDGWKYAVYVEGEEMASIKTEKQLFFKGYEGIAVDKDGEVYMLYYSSNPWSMTMFKVDLPEKVNIQEGNWITTVVHDDFECGHYGFSVVNTGEDVYIIKTSEYEAYARNGMDNLEENLEPFEGTPTFEVVKAVPENFVSCRIFFDLYWDAFVLSGRMDGPEDISYTHYFPLTEDIDKQYLGIMIPAIEEKNEVWDSDKVYESYNEAQAGIKELKDALAKWEEKNIDNILNFDDRYSGWMQSHLEESEVYFNMSEDKPSFFVMEALYKK